MKTSRASTAFGSGGGIRRTRILRAVGLDASQLHWVCCSFRRLNSVNVRRPIWVRYEIVALL